MYVITPVCIEATLSDISQCAQLSIPVNQPFILLDSHGPLTTPSLACADMLGSDQYSRPAPIVDSPIRGISKLCFAQSSIDHGSSDSSATAAYDRFLGIDPFALKYPD